MKRLVISLVLTAMGLGEIFAQSVLNGEGRSVNVACDAVHFDYYNGLACVIFGDRYVFVDGEGKMLPQKYDAVGFFDSNNLCVVQIGDKYGVVDPSASQVLAVKYDSIGDFSPEGFAEIVLNGKTGFINTSAQVVVAPKYSAVGTPSESGLRWVNVGGTIDENGECRGGKFGYIDGNLKEVVAPMYTFVGEVGADGICWVCLGGKEFVSDKAVEAQMSSFSQRETNPAKILAKRTELENAITGGKVDVLGRKIFGGKYGFVSVEGNSLTEIIYTRTANGMTDGYAWVSLNGKYGYIDSMGKTVVPCIYEEVAPSFSGNVAWARKLVKKEALYGYVNRQGGEAGDFIYSKVTDVKEGMAVVCTPAVMEKGVVRQAAKYGLVDVDGQPLTEPKYDGISMLSEGMALCKKSNRYCFVNARGEEVTPFIINTPSRFIDGVAIVKLCPDDAAAALKGGKLVKSPSSKRTQDGLYGIIDKSGTALTDFVYESVAKPSYGVLAVTKGGKSSFVKTTGEVLSADEYDSVKSFSYNYAAVNIGGKWGWIDASGNVVIAPAYDDACQNVVDGLFCVAQGDRWGAVDATGGVVVPFVLTSAEDLEDAIKTIYKENGRRTLTTREVSIFQARKLNERKIFGLSDTIPQECWDY